MPQRPSVRRGLDGYTDRAGRSQCRHRRDGHDLGPGDFATMATWIKQLNPSDMKWATLVAGRNWRAKPDLTLAAWIDQLPLSAADKADAVKGPYPDSSRISRITCRRRRPSYKTAPTR